MPAASTVRKNAQTETGMHNLAREMGEAGRRRPNPKKKRKMESKRLMIRMIRSLGGSAARAKLALARMEALRAIWVTVSWLTAPSGPMVTPRSWDLDSFE